MSTLLGKDSHHSLASSSSFIENACGSNNSPASSHEDFDDETTEFKPNPSITATRLNAQLIARKEISGSATMGGISIPHHGLSAAFHGYHSANASANNSASNNINQAHHHHYHSSNYGSSNSATNYSASKTPFLLPAQLYKSLFANAVLQNPEKMCSHPFPRNLLFSYSEKSPTSPDFDAEEKVSIADEVSFTAVMCINVRYPIAYAAGIYLIGLFSFYAKNTTFN